MDGLIWAALPRATVGLVVRAGTVVDCPPYVRRWALGQDANTVIIRLRNMGARVVRVA